MPINGAPASTGSSKRTLRSLPPSFEDAFEKFKLTASSSDARDFASTTLSDVWKAVQEVEQQLAARKSLRNTRRIQPLLERLKLISVPIDVLCNGTPYLPWIWAPIKLVIHLASQHSDILEKLLEAYAVIGNALPRIDRLGNALTDNSTICHILCVVYVDILEFHRRTYKFFRRRGWRNFFQSSWSSFEYRFKSIIHSLEKHSDWLDREANSIDIVEAKQWRTKLIEDTALREKERLDLQFLDAMRWLAVDDQEDELEVLSNRCQPDTCDWLFQNQKITSWKEESADDLFLWLKGIPGSGKSVLCSQLIQYLRSNDDCIVAYYLCSSYDNQGLCLKVLRSITAQLLRSRRDLATYIVQEYSSQGLGPSVSKLRLLLADMQQSKTRIIIDGLDETDGEQQGQILSELERLTRVKDASCKVLISSRDHTNMNKFVRDKTTLSLSDENAHIDKSIQIFINSEIQSLRNRFKNDVLDDIALTLNEKAGGMFLWVKLIFATLEDVHSIQELYSAVESLPKGLDGAYGRILERFEKRMSEETRNKVIRILSWVAFSCQPLSVHEILEGVTLHEGNTILDHFSKLKVSVLELCKPIIESASGKTVEFVHFSAREYLIHHISGPFLGAAKGHHIIALSCVLSLNACFERFKPDMSDEELHEKVVKECHSLFAYSNRFWLEHLKRAAEHSVEIADPLNVVKIHLQQMTKAKRQIEASDMKKLKGSPINKEEAGLLKHFDEGSTTKKLIQLSIAFRKLVEELSETTENILAERHNESRYAPTWHTVIFHRYQDAVDWLLTLSESQTPAYLDKESVQSFKEKFSGRPFVCRFRGCPKGTEGFMTLALREEHEKIHDRRWRCADPQCPFYLPGFRSAQNLKKHNENYHLALEIFSQLDGAKSSKTTEVPSRRDDPVVKQNVITRSKRDFVCGGSLSPGKSWGCNTTFPTADALKTHYKTDDGFRCIQGLYGGTVGGLLDREDLRPLKRKRPSSSEGIGSLESGKAWGGGEDFEAEGGSLESWSLLVPIERTPTPSFRTFSSACAEELYPSQMKTPDFSSQARDAEKNEAIGQTSSAFEDVGEISPLLLQTAPPIDTISFEEFFEPSRFF